jgi:hypothetical protein
VSDDGDGGLRDDGMPSKVKLLAYLDRAGGNVSEVARQVGKGRKVIYRLMEEYGIKGGGDGSAIGLHPKSWPLCLLGRKCWADRDGKGREEGAG